MVADLDLGQSDESQRPTTRLRNLILTEGLLKGAQAIRLRSGKEWGEVDYQLGGEWQGVMRIPVAAYPHVVSAMRDAGDVGADGNGAIQVKCGGALRRFDLSSDRGMTDDTLTLALHDDSAT